MLGARFEVEKFDRMNDFELCQIEMKALLVDHGLEGALEEENKLTVTLCLKELRKKVIGYQGSDGEGSITRGKTDCPGRKVRVRTEMYNGSEVALLDVRHVQGIRRNLTLSWSLDVLGCKYKIQDGVMKVSKDTLVLMIGVLLEGLVNQCKECTMVGKSSKSLVKRYVVLDEIGLTKQCKNASQVKVEPRAKAISWKKGRQSKPLKKYGLGELVGLENAGVVSNSTCLMVGESSAEIPTKLDISDKSKGGLDLSGTCKSRGGAHKD
ncbi:hypothetical protein CRG98_037794 [Punica granatum]|uniref:Uncharacterized protein n=1 Tax=Punica granatum TaxID=22663 RepID=A0A2I0IDU6_PUNGR|nr:hypothetical protein CRG98_037794 [Punica granatum]